MMEPLQMKTIGLVGGVASGKSRAGQMLIELGAGLLDADQAGHAVLAEDDQVRDAIRRWWGPAVFDADGSIDRRAVASRVFADGGRAAHDRQFLEELLHPRIRVRLERQRDQFRSEGRPAVVLDAPLLLEAGWGPMCDLILMLDAPREVRLERARRRGWSEAQFARREVAQWPVERKRSLANAVIDNGGSEDDLRDAIRSFWHEHVQPQTGAEPR
jgi:dephospho-CoA kinase